MKIGEIARKFDLSEQTIRYYVKKGLLIPSHSSYQYSFSERDEEDLALITTYKLLGFSLSEILNILSLYRISHVKAPKEAYQLLRIFQKKLDDLPDRSNLRAISPIFTDLTFHQKNIVNYIFSLKFMDINA